MDCPKCKSKTRVTTTCHEFSDHVRRYRKCTACHHKFVTRQGFEEIQAPAPRHKQVFLPADILEMRSLWLEGRSSREVAEIFGCTTSWVNKVVKRKVWVNV